MNYIPYSLSMVFVLMEFLKTRYMQSEYDHIGFKHGLLLSVNY